MNCCAAQSGQSNGFLILPLALAGGFFLAEWCMSDDLQFARRRPVTVQLKIYVDEVTAEAAEARAAMELESLSAYVRRLIHEDIRRHRQSRAGYEPGGWDDRADSGRG